MAISAEVIEAAVQVCGTAFYYRDRVRIHFISAGTPPSLYDRFDSPESSKFVVSRHVFSELASRGASGESIIRKVLTDLANLDAPDDNATNRSAGVRAIAKLREVATAKRVFVDTESAGVAERRRATEKRVQSGIARSTTLRELKKRLADLTRGTVSRQSRGYQLEGLLSELFTAFQLTYRPSYRIPHEQLDGAFEYKGFHYLVEARWRAEPPDMGHLAHFKSKVDGKLESTRGVFLSWQGFNAQVIDHFMGVARGTSNNLILVDGYDVSIICDEMISLPDALDYKINKASQEGLWWAPLAAMI